MITLTPQNRHLLFNRIITLLYFSGRILTKSIRWSSFWELYIAQWSRDAFFLLYAFLVKLMLSLIVTLMSNIFLPVRLGMRGLSNILHKYFLKYVFCILLIAR